MNTMVLTHILFKLISADGNLHGEPLARNDGPMAQPKAT